MLMEYMHRGTMYRDMVNGKLTNDFDANSGAIQEGILSLLMVILFISFITSEVLK